MNRLFLAVPVRLNDYERIKTRFSPQLQGRWREESTLHLTLAFLGNLFSESALLEKLHDFDWEFSPSELDGFDYFTQSRVFVATAQNASLQQLRQRLEIRLDLPPEILRPHVTLMRVKKITDPASFSALLPMSQPIGRMESSIALYRSRLTPDGARYSIVKEWKP